MFRSMFRALTDPPRTNRGSRAGNDPRNLSTQCLDILTNREIIAVSQDPLVVRGKLVYQGTPGAGQPTAKPVPINMGGGLLWWPNASWVPVVPPIGAGTLSTYERIPKTYNVSDCIGCGDPPESLCWNDSRPSVPRGEFAEGAHCNKPGVGVNVSHPHHAFTLQVWARPLHNGDVAIVAFNRGAAPVQASVTAEMAGLKSLSALTVRDLWLKKELPTPSARGGGGATRRARAAPSDSSLQLEQQQTFSCLQTYSEARRQRRRANAHSDGLGLHVGCELEAVRHLPRSRWRGRRHRQRDLHRQSLLVQSRSRT